MGPFVGRNPHYKIYKYVRGIGIEGMFFMLKRGEVWVCLWMWDYVLFLETMNVWVFLRCNEWAQCACFVVTVMKDNMKLVFCGWNEYVLWYDECIDYCTHLICSPYIYFYEYDICALEYVIYSMFML